MSLTLYLHVCKVKLLFGEFNYAVRKKVCFIHLLAPCYLIIKQLKCRKCVLTIKQIILQYSTETISPTHIRQNIVYHILPSTTLFTHIRQNITHIAFFRSPICIPWLLSIHRMKDMEALVNL